MVRSLSAEVVLFIHIVHRNILSGSGSKRKFVLVLAFNQPASSIHVSVPGEKTLQTAF